MTKGADDGESINVGRDDDNEDDGDDDDDDDDNDDDEDHGNDKDDDDDGDDDDDEDHGGDDDDDVEDDDDDDDHAADPICYFSGATLVWVNLYVRSFEKIDDVKVRFSPTIILKSLTNCGERKRFVFLE